MRLAALRSVPPDRPTDIAEEEATEAVLEALPAGLRTLDVMELSLAAVRTAALRHTLTAHPPDVLITVPRSSCRTLDFHKAEEMIRLGRLLTVEALDRAEDRSPLCAVPGRT
jgi:NTE family protein